MNQRLTQQLAFIVEIDKLKRVLRQTLITDGSRQENSAEHSWHLALMALLLREYAPEPVDLLRVVKMVLIHDIVEIDAGDTFCYDTEANLDKTEREQLAAARLFGLLPGEEGAALHTLWEEFEAMETSEARFANALDRLQPLLHNYHTEGGSWRTHSVQRTQVEERLRPIRSGMPDLWPMVERVLDGVVAAGWLADSAQSNNL